MRKNIIYSLLLVVAALFAGCDSRLDIEKHGNMGDQNDFYQTDEQIEQLKDLAEPFIDSIKK